MKSTVQTPGSVCMPKKVPKAGKGIAGTVISQTNTSQTSNHDKAKVRKDFFAQKRHKSKLL